MIWRLRKSTTRCDAVKAILVTKGMDAIPERRDHFTVSTLEAQTGPQVKCSRHRTGQWVASADHLANSRGSVMKAHANADERGHTHTHGHAHTHAPPRRGSALRSRRAAAAQRRSHVTTRRHRHRRRRGARSRTLPASRRS
eukprot:60010-Chlamydomonas_euryale.AAC.1